MYACTVMCLCCLIVVGKGFFITFDLRIKKKQKAKLDVNNCYTPPHNCFPFLDCVAQNALFIFYC